MSRGRIYLLIALVVVLGLVLAACATQPQTGGGTAPESGSETATAETPAGTKALAEGGAWRCPEGEKRLVLWHFWDGDYYESISEIFAAYEKTCPNITIELVSKEKLNEDIAALQNGELDEEWPDMVGWVNDRIGDHARSGFIVPLNPYLDADEFQRQYVTTAVEAVTYDDQVWGYPESMEVITMFFNRDLISFRDLPSTTDELLSQAENWNKTDYYLVYNARDDAYFSAPWWQAAGVTIIDEAGNTNIASKGMPAAKFIASLRAYLPEELNYDIATQLFKEGKAPIIINGPWFTADARSAGIDYGLEMLPVFSPSGAPATPFVGVKLLMLTAKGEERGNAAAAVNVMQFYTSAESQAKLVKDNAMIPANYEAMSALSAEEVPSEVEAFSRQALNGKPMPSSPYMSAMWEPMKQGLECIWEGAKRTADCVNMIQTLAEENVAAMQE